MACKNSGSSFTSKPCKRLKLANQVSAIMGASVAQQPERSRTIAVAYNRKESKHDGQSR